MITMERMRWMNHWETNPQKVEALLQKSLVIRLALCDGDQPYIVPVNYGFQVNRLIFHSRTTGTKVDLLSNNPQVSFQVDADVAVVPHDEACRWSMTFKSIVGSGTVRLIQSQEEKIRGLDLICKHYCSTTMKMSTKMIERTNVYEISVTSLTYRESEPPAE